MTCVAMSGYGCRSVTCVAVCCSVLQCGESIVLAMDAGLLHLLQCVAVCCSIHSYEYMIYAYVETNVLK